MDSERFSGASQNDGAIELVSPRGDVPRQPSSRKRGSAETRPPLTPNYAMSPQPSSAKRRNARARVRVSPTTTVREQPIPGNGTGDVQSLQDDRRYVDIARTIDEIREQWRRRQAWHRAEKSLTQTAKAMCRRLLAGDKAEAEKLYKSAINGQDHTLAPVAHAAMLPLLDARGVIEKHRKAVEKRLIELAKTMPVAPWVNEVRGFGILSLAAIVGEAGDLSAYSNPAKLWKRMGLAVMGDGKRQRRVEGVAALEHGYSPSRRSVMWNIGDCIIKAGGPLKALYDERKALELTRVATKAHAHNRAKRYIEKRLLRDLWQAWRDQ